MSTQKTKTEKAKEKPARAKSKTRASPPRTKRETGLNFEQQAFVDELLAMERRVAWKAYQRAYRVTDRKVCEAAASRLLSLVKVQKAIAAGEQARLKRVQYSQDQMFNRMFTMLTADVNEIVEHRRENCRHCYGKDFLYQWIDEEEHEKVCEEIDRSLEDGQLPNYPSTEGGFGFDAHALPNPDCPNCGGDGYPRVVIQDTRFLSPGARMLYQGVKQTKEGMEVKTIDQFAVARTLMQHMGMLDPKLTLKGDAENPLMALLGQLQGNTLKPVDEG